MTQPILSVSLKRCVMEDGSTSLSCAREWRGGDAREGLASTFAQAAHAQQTHGAVARGGAAALTCTRFCATKTTQSLPRTASDVKPLLLTAFSAYSARRRDVAGEGWLLRLTVAGAAFKARSRARTNLVQPAFRAEHGDGSVPVLARHLVRAPR